MTELEIHIRKFSTRGWELLESCLNSPRFQKGPQTAGDMDLSGLPPEFLPHISSHYIITAEEIVVDRKSPLGKNRRGSVFKGSWNDSLVAVKILSDETPLDSTLNHIKTWQNLRHPHVLQVFGVSLNDTGPSFVVSQYYSNGDAKEFLINNPRADRAKIMFECALGMKYLHGRGLVHGSLKPTNILVAYNGQVCIADYGMIEIEPSRSIYAHQYFSPEAWKGIISKPSDVFAFAMNSYEIFMSTPPWGVLSDNHIYQLVVREDNRPDRLNMDFEHKRGLTDQIWETMEAAWQKDANLRPTFAQIVNSWEIPHNEGAATLLQPGSSSSSGADASNARPSQKHNVHDSQRMQNRFSTWQSSPDADAMSTSSMPPAYRDLSTRGPHPSRSPSIANDTGGQMSGTTHFVKSAFTRNLPCEDILSSRSPFNGSGNEHSPLGASSLDSRTALNLDSSLRHSYLSGSAIAVSSPQLPRVSSSVQNNSYEHLQIPVTSERHLAHSGNPSQLNERQIKAQRNSMISDTQSIRSGSNRGGSDRQGLLNPVLLAGALHSEVMEGRKQEVIDDYLRRVQFVSSQSYKETQKLVTAGIVPTVILLLKARAVDTVGLELVLVTLGILACDPITANTIYRTNTASTLIELFSSSDSDNIMALSAWCISRICRSAEVATDLIKQDLGVLLIRKGLKGNLVCSRSSAWCLGILPYTDSLALTLASYDIVMASVDHLRQVTANLNAEAEDICAALYVIARMARSIPLSKSLLRAGCVPLVVGHLSQSNSPEVLQWSARAVGCLMRPSGSDIAKVLIDAGSAKALARLPRLLHPQEVYPQEVSPLASFAFAIQRFSCAEWGAGTRKELVDAGVVDSLLAALRTSADVACPQIHIELALAVSSLGDVGGTSIRKEITKAGGIDILKQVGTASKPEVAKACDLAVKSITGNPWTRNAASIKTIMAHNWSGGCLEYQPPCPGPLTVG